MAWRDRLREVVEDYAGVSVQRAGTARLRETEYAEARAMADDAEDLALRVADSPELYGPDAPAGIGHWRRRNLRNESRRALLRDPLAGAEADTKSNFSFGRGIGMPNAAEEKVQEVIERFWDDPINDRKLTGFEAQRYLSNELLAGANLFPTAFPGSDGRVRMAFIDPEVLGNIVVSKHDDQIPLWYTVRRLHREWDMDKDDWKVGGQGEEMGENGRPRVDYLSHWRFVDLMRDAGMLGDDEMPPDEKIAPGLVEHFRINRVGRTEWGTPPWARALRYFNSMGQFTNARVSMAQAAATIIATRTVKGGPKEVIKSATRLLNRQGDMSAARLARRGENVRAAGQGTAPPHGAPPPPAGSWWNQNESDKLEAVGLQSGAAAAMQDGQIIRAPIAAQSQLGQHWLGDASSTNMATATTLELPALMMIGAWQETFERLLRWSVNRAIETAFRAGELGGTIAERDTGDPRRNDELVYEEDRAEMEARTGLDLSYRFQLPYPGRRNLPDVVTAVNAVIQIQDPSGVNAPLRRKLLDFLFRDGLSVEDPGRDVDEILEAYAEAGPGSMAPMPATGASGDEAGVVPAGQAPNDERSQYGEARRSTPPPREMGGGPAANEGLSETLDASLAAELTSGVDLEFNDLLADPAAFLAGRAPARSRPELNGGRSTSAV